MEEVLSRISGDPVFRETVTLLKVSCDKQKHQAIP